MFNRDFTFYEFNDSNKFRELSFKSKVSSLNEFSDPLKQFHNLKAKKENVIKDKVIDCVECSLWIIQWLARKLFLQIQ